MRGGHYSRRLLLKLFGQDRILVDTVSWGGRFVLNLNRAVDRQIYLRRFEPLETKIVSSLLDAGGVCIDVGANIGYYTTLMARCVGASGHVLAFEPGMRIRPWLEVNVDINLCSQRVTIFDKAASNIASKVMFHECVDAAYSSMLIGATDYAPESRRYGVEAVRLDDIANDVGHTESVSMIKIDVEGGESLVIEGAWDLIDRSRPILMIEYFHLSLRGQLKDKGAFIGKLLERGYSGFVLEKRRSRIVEFLEPSVEGNLIFIHSANPGKIQRLKELRF